jgi:CBS domain containing-hemolysin-like protein
MMHPVFLPTAAITADPPAATTAALVGLLAVAAAAAIQARAVRGARRHRLQEICREQGMPERYDEIIDASETVAFLSASVVTVATALATILAAILWVVPSSTPAGAAARAAAFTSVLWMLLVVAPMVVTWLAGPSIAVSSWGFWRGVVGLANPVMAAVGRLSWLVGRIVGHREEPLTNEELQDELRLVVDEAHRDGRLQASARDMIEGVIDLGDVKVSQIMTNRTDMMTLSVGLSFDEVVREAAESGHSRIPIWEDSPDNIIGMLHTRELLTELSRQDAERPDLRTLLRSPFFVPESKSVQKLLREFQQTHTHMALVTNEFGGVAGLVTIEDALEEIVGEIADEHDEDTADGLRIITEGVAEARAQVRLEEINERLGLKLPEEADFATIGGLVFHLAGRIPSIGEAFDSDGVRLQVLGATRRRIDWVRIERLPEPVAG